MTKISVIIPVFNTEEYVEDCVKSVLNQTLKEIEVICVDDGSTDSSYMLLQNMAEQDSRLKVFRFNESRSALQARKKGIQEAVGEYIMFLDADDYLELTACEVLYEKMREVNVDILHFRSVVENCGNLSEDRIKMNQKIIEPHEGIITNGKVFAACFIKKKFYITLWNKIFRAELCKKACKFMEDSYLPKAQDYYAFFIIAFFADSYYGWSSEPLHHYCFGRGVTGTNRLNLDKFRRYCTQANVYHALVNFCEKQNIMDSYSELLQERYDIWIIECLNLWIKKLPTQLSVEGMEILYDYWGPKETISYLARTNFYNRVNLASRLQNFRPLPLKNREVRTVAFYYYHLDIGGVQRVISLLTDLVQKMGYRVVVITDKPESTLDYPLPEGVRRLKINSWCEIDRENIRDRMEIWEELVQENQIDVVLYNAWTSNLLFWDLMCLKGLHVSTVVHCHSVFSYALNTLGKMMIESCRTLGMADGIVVLSEADRVYWNAFNDNVHYIPNPISEQLSDAIPGKFDNKAVIWVGRCSNEKQPWQAFNIFAEVVSAVPNARLYMVGDFSDPKWEKLAIEKGLQSNVIFTGPTHDVNHYYEKASIYLNTSQYEGFPMTLAEAQAHALPGVIFSMPNLTMAAPGRGVISVENRDYTAAAERIIRLLQDAEYWKVTSKQAYASFCEAEKYDLEGAWKDVLEGKKPAYKQDYAVTAMIHTAVNHYQEGLRYQKQQKNIHVKENSATNTVDIIKDGKKISVDLGDYTSYKIGRFITYIPRKINGGFRCIQDHGLSYTVKLAFKKIRKQFMR